MEKLEQMDMNCLSAIECAKFEVCVEKTKIKPERLVNITDHEESVKSRLSRLFKKSKLNAKYIEQLIPIEKLEYQRVYRNYGIY